VWLAVVIVGVAGPAMAQTSTSPTVASAVAQDAFQLTPAATTVTRPIVVDRTPLVTVSVLAASQTLRVTLISPTGIRYVVDGSSNVGFSSAVLPIDSLTTRSGASYVGALTDPETGTWSLEVHQPGGLTAPLEVIRLAVFDNKTQMILVGGGEDYPLGRQVRLAAVVFDRTARVKPLIVDARYFRVGDPTFVPASIAFRDDGSGADSVAGDGIYEAFVQAPAVGRYQVQAQAAGGASTGAFSRTSSAVFEVVPLRAAIQGFTDRGIDLDFDRQLDQVAVALAANVAQNGTYDVMVKLRASNGNELQHSQRVALGTGIRTVDVLFDSALLTSQLGVDGPYQVVEAKFLFNTATDGVPADIKYNLGSTAAYRLSSFDTPPLSLTGAGADGGIDANGNGRFDEL
jgi:hypothetical protein